MTALPFLCVGACVVDSLRGSEMVSTQHKSQVSPTLLNDNHCRRAHLCKITGTTCDCSGIKLNQPDVVVETSMVQPSVGV